jgi:MoxR-like ATPase
MDATLTVRNFGSLEHQLEEFTKFKTSLHNELDKLLVGLEEVIDITTSALICDGHILLEGAPGLGKTLLVKSLGQALGLPFKRIQFTPDLMPADITGTHILTEDAQGSRSFQFKQGPLFANIILADEINRATPKTQSALLEAMEEKQVTALDQTFKLDEVFFVLATQNPIEHEGTYQLPEAQLDRFIAKAIVPSPSAESLKQILLRTTGSQTQTKEKQIDINISKSYIKTFQNLVKEVVVAPKLIDKLVEVMTALDPLSKNSNSIANKYVRYAPGPRGAQSVLKMAKAKALKNGRIHLSIEDIKEVFIYCLRHRLILNYLALSDNISADSILAELLAKV